MKTKNVMIMLYVVFGVIGAAVTWKILTSPEVKVSLSMGSARAEVKMTSQAK